MKFNWFSVVSLMVLILMFIAIEFGKPTVEALIVAGTVAIVTAVLSLHYAE